MPSISQTTPTVHLTPVDMTRNGVVDRRAASPRQSTTITPTEWPLVTRTAYNKLVQGVVDQELTDLRKRRLCTVRNALSTALLAIDGSMYDHRPKQAGLSPEQVKQHAKVWQRLRAQRGKVEKALLEMPLEVR